MIEGNLSEKRKGPYPNIQPPQEQSPKSPEDDDDDVPWAASSFTYARLHNSPITQRVYPVVKSKVTITLMDCFTSCFFKKKKIDEVAQVLSPLASSERHTVPLTLTPSLTHSFSHSFSLVLVLSV